MIEKFIQCEFNKYHLKIFVATLKDLRLYNQNIDYTEGMRTINLSLKLS